MPEQAIEMSGAGPVAAAFLLPAAVIGGIVALERGRRFLRRKPLRHPDIDTPLLERPWDASDALFIFLMLGATQALIALLARARGIPEDAGQATMLMLSAGLGFQIAGLGYIRLLMLRRRHGWRDAFGSRDGRANVRPLRLALWFYLGIWPVQLAVVPAYHALLRRMGLAIDWQQEIVLLTSAQPARMTATLLFMALVMAPVTEELVFRGILLPALRRHIGLWPAILASSLLFAAFHGHAPSAAGLFILSLACSLACVAGGTVTTAIWLHAVFNTGSTILAWLFLAP